LLKEIWAEWDDYHHLNLTVPTGRTKLQDIAKRKIIALHKVESEVFAFDVIGGAIKPRYHKYWDKSQNGSYLNAFLKLEP
jgi:hypothetical protein